MAIAQPANLMDELTEFLARSPSPEEIIAFRPSEELSRRAMALLERNRANMITKAEHDEMQDFMLLEHFVTMLKAKARLNLDRP